MHVMAVSGIIQVQGIALRLQKVYAEFLQAQPLVLRTEGHIISFLGRSAYHVASTRAGSEETCRSSDDSKAGGYRGICWGAWVLALGSTID